MSDGFSRGVPCRDCESYEGGNDGCGVCMRRLSRAYDALRGLVGLDEIARLCKQSAVREDDRCYFGRGRS